MEGKGLVDQRAVGEGHKGRLRVPLAQGDDPFSLFFLYFPMNR